MTTPLEPLTAALADRYRIDRQLGQGGMATVYLADDIRHNRKVALKVLRPELAAVIGGERFLQEITTTANLQHPHILPLFDSGQVTVNDPIRGESIRTVFYVMPFVEGESLRDRLVREKQLPVEDAIRLAREVASALHYAHKRGVVHRDIKPENILLHDGQALVADFGIALAASTAGGARLTETGLSLGTPQYMSPEQAMGERTLDARSDVYALGCVLHEMLAGEAPFTGPTVQAVVARVLTERPRSLRAERHTVPEHVEAAVIKALEKLPADRFATAAEFAEAIAGATAGRSTGIRTTDLPTYRPPARRTALRIAPWLLATAAIAVAAWSLTRTPAVPVKPVVRYSLVPPENLRILDVGGPPAKIQPDGAGLVYVSRAAGGVPLQLVRWPFDGGTPEPIPGTENATWPFFSPDGKWIGFLGGGILRKVRLDGGGVVTIGSAGTAVGSFRGATWTSKGSVVFATSSGLQEIPADGGPARQLSMVAESGELAFFPEALPGGDFVVVAVLNQTASNLTELAVMSLATGKLVRLGQPGSNPTYVDPGYLAFTNTEGGLLAVRFDPRRRRILGSSRPIAQGLSLGTAGVGKLAVSRNGTVAYLEGMAVEERRLVRVDRRGGIRAFDAPPRSYNGPRIAPDGRRIAVTLGAVPNPPMDLWVYDIVLGNLSRVTFDSTSVHAEWSADGSRLYHRRSSGGYRAVATTPDGSAPPDSLYATAADLWEVVPSRSGDTIITRELRSVETDRDLMLVPLRPAGPAVPWAAGPRIQAEPAFSPDGRWLAYSSDESGSAEVYVRAFPGPGPRYLASLGGGTAPRWNPRGGELFYLSADSLVAVSVSNRGTTLEFGRGKALFANRFAPLNFHAPYDVSPDGSWFAFVGMKNDGKQSGSLRVVHNWFEQPWK